MRCDNQYIMDKVYSGEVTRKEINEIFTYLVGRELWRQYLKYERGERNGT